MMEKKFVFAWLVVIISLVGMFRFVWTMFNIPHLGENVWWWLAKGSFSVVLFSYAWNILMKD